MKTRELFLINNCNEEGEIGCSNWFMTKDLLIFSIVKMENVFWKEQTYNSTSQYWMLIEEFWFYDICELYLYDCLLMNQ